MTIACITVFQPCNISSVVFMKFSFILPFMLSYILPSNIECSHLCRMKGNEQKTWEAVCCSGGHGELMDNWLFLEQSVSTYVHVVVILKVFLQPCKSQGQYSVCSVGQMNEEFGFAFWQGQEILLISRESRPVLGLTQSHIQQVPWDHSPGVKCLRHVAHRPPLSRAISFGQATSFLEDLSYPISQLPSSFIKGPDSGILHFGVLGFWALSIISRSKERVWFRNLICFCPQVKG